jgi:hypothetical protein
VTESAAPSPEPQPQAAPEVPAPAPEVPPTNHRRPDPWAHRRGEPRTFAALWILYLFGATATSLGAVGMAGLLATDVYRPAAQMLLALVGVGVTFIWPMARLSQIYPQRPLQAAALDVVVIAAPVQAVIWPQVLAWMAAWPLPVVIAVSMMLFAWTALIGGVLACVFQTAPTGSNRAFAMILIAVLTLIGPALMLLEPAKLPDPAQPNHVSMWAMTSPGTAAYELTRDRSWSGATARIDTRHWLGIGAIAAGAAGAWSVAAASRTGRLASRTQPA